MFEQHETQAGQPASNTDEELNSIVLATEGFNSQEIAGLLEAQDRYRNGYLSEWPDNPEQLRFARWLYEHKHIEG
ncbi:MAG: hypothetical protein ACJ78Q_01980 [Chloroflexia bacterium]